MGVAVITSMWGLWPFSRRESRCSTPNRCCSSTMASPIRLKATPSWINAWVPMTTAASPLEAA